MLWDTLYHPVFGANLRLPQVANIPSSYLLERNGIQSRHTNYMDSVAKYSIKDLFFEALAIEWRILYTLGQAVAGSAVFIAVQLVNIVTYPATVVIDLLSLFLGFEVRTIIGIPTTDDID